MKNPAWSSNEKHNAILQKMVTRYLQIKQKDIIILSYKAKILTTVTVTNKIHYFDYILLVTTRGSLNILPPKLYPLFNLNLI